MIDVVKFSTGLAVGDDDAAEVTGYSPRVCGEVLAVYVAYDTAAAAPDFYLLDEGDPAEEDIVSLENQKTDIKIYPRRLVETNDGTDVTYDGTYPVYEPYVVCGRLMATLEDADADDSCEVTVWLRR